MMNKENLLPFNGKTIQTKELNKLGFSNKDIKKLLDNTNLERTRRGYYKVNLKYSVNYKLLEYYLINDSYLEFYNYFNSLEVKDYKSYYYKFMCDIQSSNYAYAYDSLKRCCELNILHDNKLILYSFILLLEELLNITPDRVEYLKSKILEETDSENLFLETILKKDYDNACKRLSVIKKQKKNTNLELNTLRKLSMGAKEVYRKKNTKESKEYALLINNLHNSVMDNNFERAYYYFEKLKGYSNKNCLDERLVLICDDLFKCFNYIVEHPNLDLTNYQTDYEYKGSIYNSFFTAINKNDYIKALDFCRLILSENKNVEFSIYMGLLERIYNFLNVRLIIKGKNLYKKPSKLNDLIKHKKYSEALEYTKDDPSIENGNKNILTSLLESILSVDNMNVKI